MIVNGHINFFTISECGLFQADTDSSFGIDVDETFSLIANWVAENDFESTLPWAKDKWANGALCYCHDLYHDDDTGDYLVVLWKSGPGSSGKLLGADPTATVGKGKIVEYGRKFRKPVIWGYPCYYWVMPSLKMVASIKFEHSICDKDLFQDWIVAAITSRVKHPNKEKIHTSEKYVRLHFTDGSQGSTRFRYSFKMSLKILQTSSTRLSDLQSRITHIVKRETIELKHRNDREKWMGVFDSIINSNSVGTTKRQIEVKVEAKPSLDELKNIIEKHGSAPREKGDWDRVGFDTDSGKVWVDEYRMTSSLNFKYDSSVISAADLFNHLDKARGKHLNSAKSVSGNAKPKLSII